MRSAHRFIPFSLNQRLETRQMTDRWKSLAEKLGAPGLEPSARRPREASPPPKASSSAEDKESKAVESKAVSGRSDDSPSSPSADSTETKPTEQQDWLPTEREREPSQVEQNADLASANQPPVPATDIPEQPPTKLASPAPKSPPAEAPPSKKKKRSNWERLANLFSIAPDHSDAPDQTTDLSSSSEQIEPDSQDQPAADDTSATRGTSVAQSPAGSGRQPTIFDSEEDSAGKNPVLSEMFGQTESKIPHESWQAPKRVVNDIGWDDEEPSSKGYPEEKTAGQFESQPPAKGRQRQHSNAESSSEAGADTGEETEYLAERRSSRRRRRRGDASGVASRPPREEEPLIDEVPSEVVSEDVDFDTPAETQEVAATEFPAKRRKRRRRSRGGNRPELETGSDAPPESLDDDSELYGEAPDDSDDDDSEHRGSQKSHRNIPSWEDSLATMIDANVENHRRGDHRGSRGGGRPRGRR
jgi:hypothetical protein